MTGTCRQEEHTMKFLRHLMPARQLALTLLLLLGCVALYAAGDETPPQQVVVCLDQAGTLPDKLDDSQKKETASLKVIGNVNGTDIALIREMARWNKGVLATLDLSEARIVSGGSPYYKTYETSQDEIGDYMFSGCTNLVSVELPKGVKAIGNGAFSVCREFDPTGVSHAAATAEAAEMSRYTLGGVRLGTPARGLNIVKRSDGTVKKAVVK